MSPEIAASAPLRAESIAKWDHEADVVIVGYGGAGACAAIEAARAGASVLLLERAGADPAIAPGPFVTTLVDLLGILIYFNVARALLAL